MSEVKTPEAEMWDDYKRSESFRDSIRSLKTWGVIDPYAENILWEAFHRGASMENVQHLAASQLSPDQIPRQPWTSTKPVFTNDCLVICASEIRGQWSYTLFQVKLTEFEGNWYRAWLTADGEEYGDLADMHANQYFVMPLFDPFALPMALPPNADQIVRERLEGMLSEYKHDLDNEQERDWRASYYPKIRAIETVLSLLSESEPVSLWVKTEDRLPTAADCDANGRVLFWDSMDKEAFPFEPEHALQHRHYTHWQPLPRTP